ncbi:MAG: hypothetical protein Q8L98_04175 [Chlamydiales bacterium]|nr:hypothetical protein [Chlamydiales bacterium]
MSTINFTEDFAVNFLMFFDEDLEEPNISNLTIKIAVLAITCILGLQLVLDTWNCHENVRDILGREMNPPRLARVQFARAREVRIQQENEAQTDSHRLRRILGQMSDYRLSRT